MSKLERLLKLLAALLDAQVPLTAESLRTRIGGYPDNDPAFRRTFERDKEDLRAMGVELVVQPVPDLDPPVDGYRVDAESYAGRDPGLEPDELAALHLAAALVRVDGGADDAVRKLGGAPAVDAPHLAEVPTTQDTADLHDAVLHRRLASFTYQGVDRELEPNRLTFARGRWYVSGFDRSRNADRVFRLDRIDGPVAFGPTNAFEPSDARGPQLQRTWELGDEAPRQARVRIEADMAIWATSQLRSTDIVETLTDGSIIVALNVRNTEMFRDWILSFLDDALVLDPPELVEEIIDWLKAIA